MNNEWALKKEIVEVGHKLWDKGFVAANDGNITIKLNDKEFLTTPTGVSKKALTVDMIIKVDMHGQPLVHNANYRPSSEAKMHIEVYQQRPDIGAIVHSHPPFCTSFAVAGIPLDKFILPEAILTIGAVPITPYGLPSTMEIPDAIRPYIQNTDAVLLANHGALTMGKNVNDAYFKTETLEHNAHILFRSMQLGNVNVISEPEVDRLMELRDKLNIRGKIIKNEKRPSSDISEALIEEITKKVLDNVRKGL